MNYSELKDSLNVARRKGVKEYIFKSSDLLKIARRAKNPKRGWLLCANLCDLAEFFGLHVIIQTSEGSLNINQFLVRLFNKTVPTNKVGEIVVFNSKLDTPEIMAKGELKPLWKYGRTMSLIKRYLFEAIEREFEKTTPVDSDFYSAGVESVRVRYIEHKHITNCRVGVTGPYSYYIKSASVMGAEGKIVLVSGYRKEKAEKEKELIEEYHKEAKMLLEYDLYTLKNLKERLETVFNIYGYAPFVKNVEAIEDIAEALYYKNVGKEICLRGKDINPIMDYILEYVDVLDIKEYLNIEVLKEALEKEGQDIRVGNSSVLDALMEGTLPVEKARSEEEEDVDPYLD